jgi:UDP-glucose:(glucosyl)LPS alpha-1,2-glucosyltransferase
VTRGGEYLMSENNYDLIEVNELSQNSKGGTELQLKRIYDGKIPRELLEQFQIIPSRVREVDQTRYRLYYCHDLPGDPEANKAVGDGGWNRFHRCIFVSNWQAQRFMEAYKIPWSRCVVMANAIEPILGEKEDPNDDGIVRLIYHTTPHRGLNILLPVFTKLLEKHPNLHLDVFSSFKLYGWHTRDGEFKQLFDFMEANPEHITDHGSVSQDVVRKALANADIFAYPSIWPETSCLCLMEAMSAGLNCVHPNYGALYETAAGWTSMYHFHEDLHEHAKIFYMMLDNAIEHNANENLQGRVASQKVYADAFYGWNQRANQWHALLQSIVNGGEEREIKQVDEKEFVYQVG